MAGCAMYPYILIPTNQASNKPSTIHMVYSVVHGIQPGSPFFSQATGSYISGMFSNPVLAVICTSGHGRHPQQGRLGRLGKGLGRLDCGPGSYKGSFTTRVLVGKTSAHECKKILGLPTRLDFHYKRLIKRIRGWARKFGPKFRPVPGDFGIRMWAKAMYIGSFGCPLGWLGSIGFRLNITKPT